MRGIAGLLETMGPALLVLGLFSRVGDRFHLGAAFSSTGPLVDKDDRSIAATATSRGVSDNCRRHAKFRSSRRHLVLTSDLRQQAYIKASNTGTMPLSPFGGSAGPPGAKAANADQGDSLDAAVALSDDGNTLFAGALDEDCMATGVSPSTKCEDDSKADTAAGAGYVFVRSGTNWTRQAFLKASNTGPNDWFASRLAISGDGNTIAAAAQLEDSSARGIDGNQRDESAIEAGAVYVFTRPGTMWRQLAYLKGANTEAFDEFGSSVALSRDGCTMAVGARGDDSTATGINGNSK